MFVTIMKYTIREANRSDIPAILGLVQELAEYEKEPEAVEVSVAQMQEDGFGNHPKFHCFVAERGSDIIGMALVYPRYSTWKGEVLHLEDLIITEAERGGGAGTALLNAVVNYGHSMGVKRISWEVLDWNDPAIDFYESKGARVMRDWDVVQLDEEGIKNYIDRI